MKRKITQLIVEGKAVAFESLIYPDDGKDQFKLIIKSLGKYPDIVNRIINRLVVWSEQGIPPNTLKFRFERDHIFAIREEFVRIYGFFDTSRKFIIANGVIKKQNKANPTELNKAVSFRNYYMEQVKKS